MKDLRLSDLLDLAAVQKMAQSHYEAAGMPMGIIDAVDNSILAGVGWQDICLNFHRANPKSRERCHASDNYIKQHLYVGEVRRYKCKNGLWDIGIPIVVKGKHLATLFIGQFFYQGETPDKQFFIEQARQFDYDVDAYLEALDRVPVFTNEKVEYILEYDKALVTFLIDIAEQSLARKKAEDELRSLRNYLSNIIDSMPSTLVGVDTNGYVTQWNKTVEKSTGISAKDALGKAIFDMLPHMASEKDKIFESIRTRHVIQEQKKTSVTRDGIHYEDVTIYPLTTNGVEGAVIRIDDVTDRVRLEEMMIQSEKMLSVGGLAAGMAHEINNPLASMVQTAEVMGYRLGDHLGIQANRVAAENAGTTLESIEKFMKVREIPRMLTAIKESGNRVVRIVNNMLSFARKDGASATFQSIEEVIDKTLELAVTDYDLKKEYDFKLIDIKKKYASNLPDVPCEKAKIQQVLFNILRNAAQAMQDAKVREPRIIIRTSLDDAEKMVCIDIEDNGPGMDEDIRKRVFEPFFTTKPIGAGTGIGLSVAYFIITENHNGKMAVESAPGAGARFIVGLPLKKREK